MGADTGRDELKVVPKALGDPPRKKGYTTALCIDCGSDCWVWAGDNGCQLICTGCFLRWYIESWETRQQTFEFMEKS